MTVRELIAELQTLDPDLEVWADCDNMSSEEPSISDVFKRENEKVVRVYYNE